MSAAQPGQTPQNDIFTRRRRNLVLRTFVVSSLMVILVEVAIVLLDAFVDIPHPTLHLIDGLFLIAVILPFNYFFIVRPLSKYLDEHRRTNQRLVESSEVLEQLFASTDVMLAYLDARFNFIRVNQAYAHVNQREPGFFPGKNFFDLFPSAENQAIFQNVLESGEPFSISNRPFIFPNQPEKGKTYWNWTLQPVKGVSGKAEGLIISALDVTSQQRSENILRTRLRIMQFATTHTLDELLQFSVDEIEALTDSAIGFFHFLEADQKTLWLQAWSSNTLQKMCTAEGKDQHYDIDLAGVWADAVRQCQPVIHNNYISLPQRKGTPQGHAPITRELVVPVVRAGKIVAVFGVGNKAYDYTPADLDLVKTLADFAWDVIEHKRSEIAILKHEKEIERLYQAERRARHLAETLRAAGEALSGSLNSDIVLETLLDHLAQGVAYESAHLVLYDDADRLVVRKARGEETWPPQERLLGVRFDLPDSSFIMPLLSQRQVISIPDTLLLAENNFFQSHPRIRSWLGIPLLAGEQVIGVCGLEHSSPAFFDAADRQWAESIISLAATAVHNAWLYEQVQANRQRLQALSRRLVEVQELERFNIARELHDEAGQGLASVMVGLRMIERDSADPAAVIARCQEVKQIADEVLENLHRLSMDLRPAALDHLGLVAALRQHAEMVSDLHKLPVQFAVVGGVQRLPGEMETAIYRIVQEALTNIVRHANATRVDILLERRDETLVVVVEDNGVGIDPSQSQPDHLGVVGMRERAEMLGGALTIESAPGKGTTIFVEVPCPSAS